MKFKDIPKKYKEAVINLKFSSQTIANDVNDAIDNAKNWEEAKELIESSMDNIIQDAEEAKSSLGIEYKE